MNKPARKPARKSSKTLVLCFPKPATAPAKLLEAIAKQHISGLDTLETRNSDSLDFPMVSVWELKAALTAAYEAGRKAR